MDRADQIILNAEAMEYPKVAIETNFGMKFIADLTRFKKVYCFPKKQKEWEKISITASGFNLTWASRFEVNVDQIIEATISSEQILTKAMG